MLKSPEVFRAWILHPTTPRVFSWIKKKDKCSFISFLCWIPVAFRRPYSIKNNLKKKSLSFQKQKTAAPFTAFVWTLYYVVPEQWLISQSHTDYVTDWLLCTTAQIESLILAE